MKNWKHDSGRHFLAHHYCKKKRKLLFSIYFIVMYFWWILLVKVTLMKSMRGIDGSFLNQYEKRWQRVHAEAASKTNEGTCGKRFLELRRILVTQKRKRHFCFEIRRILRVAHDLLRIMHHGKNNKIRTELYQ